MKIFRFLLLAVCLFIAGFSHAQITAFINGKPVKSGATINKADLSTLEVSFKNPRMPSYVYGMSVLSVDVMNAKKEDEGYWYLRKDGSAAVEDFLKTTPATKKFRVFDKGAMLMGGNNLDWIFAAAAGKEITKTLQVKVSLLYREKTGYEQYGQTIELLEPFMFNVQVWEPKNLYLPFADLHVDKSNITADFALYQNGRLGDKGTVLEYRIAGKYGYSICAVSSDDYPGMNTRELADDFIHAAAYNASQDFVTRFSNYDLAKYIIPWKDINGSITERRRIPSLSWKNNREIKKMDLMTLYQPVTINGLKGYTFKAGEESRIDKSSKWEPDGQFVIYILDHPTNPKLTLVISTYVFNDATSTDEMDAYIKGIINAIKH
jgi:hypothetical protein